MVAESFAVSEAELTGWVKELVSIPSYPGVPAQEAGVAAYIKSVFDAEEIESWLDPLENGRANVFGRLKGTGGGRTLMFNGHLDTVPPYDMEDACVPTVQNGRMRGRGTADMKGPLAAMMAAAVALKRSSARLAGDVIFAGVADEEGGSLGCIDLIKRGYRADGVIVGEPLGLNNIAVAQKGLEWYQIDFHGRTVHGGNQAAGINAIMKAAAFIDEVRDTLVPALGRRSHPVLGSPTVNIAVINGGTQPSTVAGKCRIQLDRRFLPASESWQSATGELQAILDGLAAKDAEFEAELSVMPASVMQDGFVHQGFETDKNDPLVRGCAESVLRATGKDASLMGCPCWTDGGLLGSYANIPTVVWGPGDIELCHSKEEYIDLSELFVCARAYMEMARSYCG